MIEKVEKGGPRVAEVARRIRRDYLNGTTEVAFLPAERVLTVRYGVARNTLRQALLSLSCEGLVRAERSRGYRILGPSRARQGLARIAALQFTRNEQSGRTSEEVVQALRRQCLAEGRQVLNMDIERADPAAVAQALINAQVDGAALVWADEPLLRCLAEKGIPCVALENSDRELAMDHVFQDNFGGAQQATRHLLAKGHTRLGWIGPAPGTSASSRERWLGAQSALLERGLAISSRHCAEAESEADILRMIEASDRPTAFLALWQGATIATVHAFSVTGLKLGEDADAVGWCTERAYSDLGMRLWSGRDRLPMVTWSSDALAAVVLDRLVQRERNPALSPLHIAIPTTLVLPNGHAGAVNEPERGMGDRGRMPGRFERVVARYRLSDEGGRG